MTSTVPSQHQHRGGLDFYTLARGGERSYSCSFLVNMDPDLLSLCSREDASTLDLSRDALISHTKRIFKFISLKSGREVNQFCFGSTYVQLNPNYRRFDKMDPMTWKKEGIANHWTGLRGYRKKCCKVCCNDRHCTGCNTCRNCTNGPIRGNYDGLVVLCAINRESLPNQPVVVSSRKSISRKSEDRLPDHELFSISLEMLLSTHFMYGDPEFHHRCVASARTSNMLGETQDENRRHKKYSGYVVYVAYRLDPMTSISHAERLSRIELPIRRDKRYDLTHEASDYDPEARVAATAAASVAGGGGDQNTAFPERSAADFDEPQSESFHDVEEEDEESFSPFAKSGFSGFGDNGDGDGGGGQFNDEDEDEKVLEDLEDKQLLARIQSLETENSSLTEKVSKLDHGRTWVENRLTALEGEVTTLKGAPLAAVDE